MSWDAEDETDAVFDFKVEVRCVACDAEREADDGGRLIVEGESQTIAEAKTPCECGESRIRVTWTFGT